MGPIHGMVSAIVLAAGRSVRMGDQNKLLLPVLGKPMITHVIEQIRASIISEILVVLDGQDKEVSSLISGKGLQIIINEHSHLGLTSSIQAGVSGANKKTSGFILALADMPWLLPSDFDLLIRAFIDEGAAKIIVPVWEGQRGNPVVFPSSFKDELLQHQEPNGCRGVVKSYPDQVFEQLFTNDHIIKDIDRPEDYREFIRSESLLRDQGYSNGQ